MPPRGFHGNETAGSSTLVCCVCFFIHCAYPFLHQINMTGTLWYALEDMTWMAVLYEITALCTVEAGLDGKLWYRRGLRPLALTVCILSGLFVLFILPEFDGAINLYGNLYLDQDLRGYLDKISGANEELCRRMQALGDLNAFDKITEAPQLIDIDNLLSQIYTDNEPEAAISGRWKYYRGFQGWERNRIYDSAANFCRLGRSK